MEELGLSRGGASHGVSDGVLDGVRHLRGDVLHGGGGHRDDGALHCNGEHLVHLHRDVLDGALRDARHRLLYNGVCAEHAEVGLGNDLELHPRHFAEHHGELLVRLDEDDDAALDAEASAEIEAGKDVFAVVHGVAAFSGEPETVKSNVFAAQVEGTGVPNEASIDVSNADLEIEADVGDTAILVVDIAVQECAFKGEVGANFLEKKLLAETEEMLE